MMFQHSNSSLIAPFPALRHSMHNVVSAVGKAIVIFSILVPLLSIPELDGTEGSAHAGTTYLVCPDGSGDFTTIQAAINASVNGDIIELCDATFTGNGNWDIAFLNRAITIRSQSGDPENCIIDCEEYGTSHRGFNFVSGEGPGSVLEGVTIKNGSSSPPIGFQGGGIYCSNSSPTINNCILYENGASSYGGGMACDNSSPLLTDCVFSNNSGYSGGGGMYCKNNSSPILTNCIFSDNSVDWGPEGGGGMICDNSSPTLTRCIFSGNSATAGYNGGGMLCMNNSSPNLTDCLFSNNSTYAFGGGAHFGGAYPGGTYPTLTNCTFYGNSANGGGGVGGSGSGIITINNCTFFGNSTKGVGGAGVCLQGPTADIENTIIAFSTEGGAIYCYPSSSVTITCCDIYRNTGGDYTGCIEYQNGINGNISLHPLFCDPVNGDFTLRDNSPCAPFSPPNNTCDLIGAWPVGCGSDPVTYLVCPDGGSDFTTIQAAVTIAADGDTVELCDTTFTGEGNRDIDFLGGAITVRSQSGNPEVCIIDCGGDTASTPHRGFKFVSGEESGSVLEGVTVTNGRTASGDAAGGGVLCSASSPTITNCIFTYNNTAEEFSGHGGGIHCEGANPILTHCTFTCNTAYDDGGGLCAIGSSVIVENCVFDQNVTLYGYGGGMIAMGAGDPTLIRCFFSNNSANTEAGGGLSAFGFGGQVDSCTFSNNSASGYGGGMYCGNSSSPTLTNCTFYGNSAPSGGGLCVAWEPPYSSHATLNNTIIASSIQGEAIFCDPGSNATLTCCDVFGNEGGDYSGCIAGQNGIGGNISLDPLFTDSAGEDFTLHFTSPCAPFSPPNDGCNLIGAWQVIMPNSVSPTCLEFGEVEVGSYKDLTFIIINTRVSGTRYGYVTESSSHFSIVSGGGFYSLDPGEYIIVTVRFQPVATGSLRCMIETGNNVDWPLEDVLCYGAGFKIRKDREEEEKHIFLGQNKPNPFFPVTEIRYNLPENCRVKLDIYNVLGQRVATLVDGYQSAGNKAVQWNGRDGNGLNVASGIYFYKLQAGKFTEIKKMVLLR